MNISHCKTNHIKNPIGYAMDQVAVSWIAESECSTRQAKAQVVVATDPNMETVIYSTTSEDVVESVGTKLPIALQPCTRYYWTVQVWGNTGDTAISEVNFFETGKAEMNLRAIGSQPHGQIKVSAHISEKNSTSTVSRKHDYT